MAKNSKVQTNFKASRLRYFFKEWRQHRGYTQEELGEMVGVTGPAVSQLENGKQGFTDSTLEAYAEALKCNPGDLLMRNPLDKNAPWTIWEGLKPAQRQQAIGYMASLRDQTGTDG